MPTGTTVRKRARPFLLKTGSAALGIVKSAGPFIVAGGIEVLGNAAIVAEEIGTAGAATPLVPEEEAAFATAAAGAKGLAGSAITIDEAAAALPEGVNQVQFGQLAGFSQGLADSAAASTEATTEAIANLQAAGVTRSAVATFQQFYQGVAAANPGNASAIQRAALLANILKAYP